MAISDAVSLRQIAETVAEGMLEEGQYSIAQCVDVKERILHGFLELIEDCPCGCGLPIYEHGLCCDCLDAVGDRPFDIASLVD